MPYRNAENILPANLLKAVQDYVQGEQIYIPRIEDKKLGWGMKNGTRKMLEGRNRQIREQKAQGWSVENLADYYHLSSDTIRKILYTRSRSQDRSAAVVVSSLMP